VSQHGVWSAVRASVRSTWPFRRLSGRTMSVLAANVAVMPDPRVPERGRLFLRELTAQLANHASPNCSDIADAIDMDENESGHVMHWHSVDADTRGRACGGRGSTPVQLRPVHDGSARTDGPRGPISRHGEPPAP
jgi:hypothetical protein